MECKESIMFETNSIKGSTSVLILCTVTPINIENKYLDEHTFYELSSHLLSSFVEQSR